MFPFLITKCLNEFLTCSSLHMYNGAKGRLLCFCHCAIYFKWAPDYQQTCFLLNLSYVIEIWANSLLDR